MRNRFTTSIAVLLWIIAAPAVADELPPAKLVVSKETTYFDGPLREDGTVDYVRAFDALLTKGVTKENNAAPLIWKAAGPNWGHRDEEHIARTLGVTAPLPTDLHLTDLYTLLSIAAGDAKADEEPGRSLPANAAAVIATMSREELALLRDAAKDFPAATAAADEAMTKAMHSPWSAKDHPVLAIWLKVNREPLKLIEEASRKEHYYWPVRSDEDSGMVDIILPALGASRNAARLLACRAMLHAGAGDMDAAWEDLKTGYRLARLIGRPPVMIVKLVSLSIDALLHESVLYLVTSGNLSVAQLKTLSGELKKLMPDDTFAHSIDLTERCMALDTVSMIRRHGFPWLSLVKGGPTYAQPTSEQLAAQRAAIEQFLDLNVTMKRINRWYDELVEALERPTAAERNAATQKIHEKLVAMKILNSPATSIIEIFALLKTDPVTRRQRISERLADQLVTTLMPAVTSVAKTTQDAHTRWELLRVAVSLAQHHAQQKAYPAALKDLVPDYIDRVPIDGFDEKPLRYRRTEDGYVLYSVGRDRSDDGGSVEGNEHGQPRDLGVRVPKVKAR